MGVSVPMIASNSARVTDRDIARQGRLNSFDPTIWLRGAELAQRDDIVLNNLTDMRTPRHTNFVFEPPKLISPKVSNFVSEQEFEGVVVSIDLDTKTFWARLADISQAFPDEEAEFPLDEVSIDDWPLIVPGALFSWNIGREWRDGQMRRVSEIRFRRFFHFTKATVARAAERADALASLIFDSDAFPTENSTEAR